eukprot:TRINITY_DN5339_c0_g1_i2.p1 TRINITY_DN5339_c0_g1~~TRINITY_DN5339_c0_g1_i2.p1  ORF type:complete len:161 (-),score=45.45 TRINITY_DN5339_c0_g1_i2:879-1361(-)
MLTFSHRTSRVGSTWRCFSSVLEDDLVMNVHKKQRKREYYTKNQEKIKEKRRLYYQKNKFKSKKYYEDNREKISLLEKLYKKNFREKNRVHDKRYKEENREKSIVRMKIYNQINKFKSFAWREKKKIQTLQLVSNSPLLFKVFFSSIGFTFFFQILVLHG